MKTVMSLFTVILALTLATLFVLMAGLYLISLFLDPSMMRFW